jgi:hypothetical protein
MNRMDHRCLIGILATGLLLSQLGLGENFQAIRSIGRTTVEFDGLRTPFNQISCAEFRWRQTAGIAGYPRSRQVGGGDGVCRCFTAKGGTGTICRVMCRPGA